MNKWLYKLLIVIVILLTILINIKLIEKDFLDNKTKYKDINKISNPIKEGKEKEYHVISSITNTKYNYPLDKIYKIDDDVTYLYKLSYDASKHTVPKTNDKLKEIEYASDQLYYIIRNSYPNVSLEEMGVSTPEEAYIVKSLAIIEVAMRTGESYYVSELSYLSSLKKITKVDNQLYFRAKELIEKVEKLNKNLKGVVLVPTLTLDNAKVLNLMKLDDYNIVGPYKIKLETGVLKEYKFDLLDKEGNKIKNSEIVDESGADIEDINKLSPDDEFYVKVPEDVKYYKLVANAKVKRLVTKILEDEQYNDYLTELYLDIDIDVTVEGNIS